MIDGSVKSNWKKAEREFLVEFQNLQNSTTSTNAFIADRITRDIDENRVGKAKDPIGNQYSDVAGDYKGTITEDKAKYLKRLQYFKQRSDRGRRRNYGPRITRRKKEMRKVFVKSRIIDRSGTLSKSLKTYARPSTLSESAKFSKIKKKSGSLAVEIMTNKKTVDQQIVFTVTGNLATNLGVLEARNRGQKIDKTAPELQYKPKNRPVFTNAIRKQIRLYDKLQEKNFREFVNKANKTNTKLETLKPRAFNEL